MTETSRGPDLRVPLTVEEADLLERLAQETGLTKRGLVRGALAALGQSPRYLSAAKRLAPPTENWGGRRPRKKETP